MTNSLSDVAIITGAGAHCPYNFPSGAELKRIIINLLSFYGDPIRDARLNNREELVFVQNIANDVIKILYQVKNLKEYELNASPVRHGHNGGPVFESYKKLIKDFIHKFAKAQTDSIDLYISRSTATEDDKLIGKILIGAIINHYERRIEIGFSARDWIQTIINRYIVPDNGLNFLSNGPIYITFNYDRLFEYSILHNLISHHDISIDDAKVQLNQLRTIHVYGSLGEITDDTFGVFSHADVKNIDVIRGSEANSEKEILRNLMGVNRIYIFGFAFNQINVNILFGRLSRSQWGTTEKKEIFCTSFGLSEIEKSNLKSLFERKRNVHIIFFDGRTIDEILSATVPLELEVDVNYLASQEIYRTIK